MKRIFVYLIACSLIFGTYSYAQSISKTGTSAAKFLDVPIAARGTGMGQAVVTGYDDPSTVFWNPASIVKLDNMAAHFSYTQWYEGISFNSLSFVVPQGRFGVIGINVMAFQTDEMEVTTESYQEGTGEYFTAGSYAIGLSYARKLTNNFSIGGTFKYLTERIYHSTANGLAVDIGVTYNTPWPRIRLGFAITNFGKKMRMSGEDLLTTVDIDPTKEGNNDDLNSYLKTDAFALPLNLALGVAWDAILADDFRVTVEIDATHPSDNYESGYVGTELAFWNETVFVRSGAANLFRGSMEPQYSVGGGLRYPILGNMDMSMDYAYQTHEYFNRNQHLSLTLTF